MKDIINELAALLEDKNKKYGSDNLLMCEKVLDIPFEKGILIRVLDKVNRINHLLGSGDDVNESIKDNCLDIAGYMIMMVVKRGK